MCGLFGDLALEHWMMAGKLAAAYLGPDHLYYVWQIRRPDQRERKTPVRKETYGDERHAVMLDFIL